MTRTALNPKGRGSDPYTVRMTEDEVKAVLSWRSPERRSFSEVIRWLVAKERASKGRKA